MNKKTLIAISVAIPVLGVLLFLLLPTNNNPISGTYTSNNWKEKYNWSSKDPRGLYLFSKVLKSVHPKSKIYTVTTPSQLDSLFKTKKSVNIVSVGDTLVLTPRERKKLDKLISSGSTLLFSANRAKLLDIEKENAFVIQTFHYARGAKFNFLGNTQEFYYSENGDTVATCWYGLAIPNPNPNPEIILVRYKNLAVFSKSEWENGMTYIHTAPHTLCNYNLKNNGYKYAEHIVNQLPKNKEIYLLDIARVTGPLNEVEEYEPEESPGLLDVIMKNPNWRNAFLFSILGVFLFAFFRSKRRRPLIHEAAPKVNTTRAYIETISSIYMGKQHPSSLLALQKSNFFNAIQRHFYLDLARDNSLENLKRLSEKSNYPLEKLELLVGHIRVENVEVDYTYIYKVTAMIDDFYKHCGIKKEIKTTAQKELKIYPWIWPSFGILIIGLWLILSGLYELTKANGFGVIIWILGMLVIAYSIRRIMRPLVIFSNERLTIYYPLKKEHFLIEKIKYNPESKLWELNGKSWKPFVLDMDPKDKNRMLNFYQKLKNDD